MQRPTIGLYLMLAGAAAAGAALFMHESASSDHEATTRANEYTVILGGRSQSIDAFNSTPYWIVGVAGILVAIAGFVMMSLDEPKKLTEPDEASL